jgi:glycosyltransferase involved in cell wall biosynthesis
MSEDLVDRSDQVTVSFVLIAHNEQASVARALHSVLAQDVDKEALVVDDGSTDATAKLVGEIAERERAVRLIRLHPNRGRGFARDVGVRSARGRFIATIDADIVLPPDWWPRCAHELQDADAVGGIAVPDGDVAYLHRRFALKPRARPHVAIVTGSNGAYRRELFERVSFDPDLTEGEDIALNHALQANGARLRTVPGLIVVHLENKGFLQSVRWLFHSGRGATRQLWRYREVRLPDLVFAGWLASLALSAVPRRPGRPRGFAPLLVYVSAAAAAHVIRAFAFRPPRMRLVGAGLVDTVLLSAYFCGRVQGVRDLVTRGRSR